MVSKRSFTVSLTCIPQVFLFPRDCALFATVSTNLAQAHVQLNNSRGALAALDAAAAIIRDSKLAESDDEGSTELKQLLKQRSQLYGQLYEQAGQISEAETVLVESQRLGFSSWNDLGTSHHR